MLWHHFMRVSHFFLYGYVSFLYIFICFFSFKISYIAGRLKIITNADTKGLNTFVGTFALPSLIFTSLVTLDWKTVNWIFLLAILISKCIVFFAVGIVSLLMTRPTNFGRAGILAIFCTQSNDFAIGSPILNALYHHAHPEYASYLYLMAPLSLAILNPIGYIFLELSSVKLSTGSEQQVFIVLMIQYDWKIDFN